MQLWFEKGDRLAAHGQTFEILTRLTPKGRQGMSAVYRARHLERRTEVALKIAWAAHHAALEREFDILTTVSHPAIIRLAQQQLFKTILDREDIWFIALEYMPKGSLAERTPLSVQEAVVALRQVSQAVAHLHQLGYLHLDIKPSNILQGADKQFKLSDFGVAQPLAAMITDSDHKIGGTQAYMSPEIWDRAISPDHRADIYALGLSLYTILAGRHPLSEFETQPEEFMTKLRQGDIPHPADLKPGLKMLWHLERVIFKAIALNRAGRYSTVEQFEQALSKVSMPSSRIKYSLLLRSKPVWLTTIAVLLLGLVVWSTVKIPSLIEVGPHTPTATQLVAQSTTTLPQSSISDMPVPTLPEPAGIIPPSPTPASPMPTLASNLPSPTPTPSPTFTSLTPTLAPYLPLPTPTPSPTLIPRSNSEDIILIEPEQRFTLEPIRPKTFKWQYGNDCRYFWNRYYKFQIWVKRVQDGGSSGAMGENEMETITCENGVYEVTIADFHSVPSVQGYPDGLELEWRVAFE